MIRRILCALCLLLLWIAGSARAGETGYDSPRLAQLSRQLEAGQAQALEEFLASVRGKGPLVEPYADEPHVRWVTFLWHADEPIERVQMIGGPTTSQWQTPLTRLRDTALWYRTVRIPSDARCVYWFQLDWPTQYQTDYPTHLALMKKHPLRTDPLNPRRVDDGSLLELPDAPPEPWMTRQPGIPRGEVKIHSLKSKHLNEPRYWPIPVPQTRVFDVYTPPGFDPAAAATKPYPLLILFDGNAFKDDSSMPLAIILDNLIAEKKIPPVVAAFVYQTPNRDKELTCSPAFCEFVAADLVPWMRQNYPVTKDPARTILGGLSYGGLMSTYCAHIHPELFGNVLSMSGSYPWFPTILQPGYRDGAEEGWLPGEFVKAPHRDVRFYLAPGKFENLNPYSLLEENRRFRDILLCKGYDVHYHEFSGGHDPTGFRGAFVDGMITLTGTWRDPTR